MNHKPMSDYRHTPHAFYDGDRGGKMYSVLAVALFELEMSGASMNTIANYIQRRWA